MENRRKQKKILHVNREKFIETIYHIVFYGNTVRNFNNVLMDVGNKINEHERMTIRYSIQWNIMIIIVSLIDEHEKYLFKFESKELAVKRKIISYKYIIEPILNDINKWSDIRKFRNNVLAHNFRIDSDDFKSVHLSNRLKSYNVPESTMDLATLMKYIEVITKIAEEIFKEEHQEAIVIIDGFSNSEKEINQSVEEETKRVNLIFFEVNKRINEYNSH